MSKKSNKRTVKDIDHTHPHTDRPFGTRGVYDRGKKADPDASDGDDEEREAAHPDDGHGTDRARDASRPRRVKDIDHTPPDEVGAQRTFDRGEETPGDGRERRADDASDGEDGGDTGDAA